MKFKKTILACCVIIASLGSILTGCEFDDQIYRERGEKDYAGFRNTANVESSDDKNVESSNNTNAESSNDKNVESSNNTNAESSNDKNVESSNDANAESSNDANAESRNDTNAESSNDTNAESSNDANSESSNDANSESSNDTNAESDDDIDLKDENLYVGVWTATIVEEPDGSIYDYKKNGATLVMYIFPDHTISMRVNDDVDDDAGTWELTEDSVKINRNGQGSVFCTYKDRELIMAMEVENGTGFAHFVRY